MIIKKENLTPIPKKTGVKIIEPLIEYDKNGNETHYKDSNGYERWSEYDKNGNRTRRLELSCGKYSLDGEELEGGVLGG